MAGSPKWKVYDADGEYRAACKYLEEAACLVDFLGDGSTIRAGHDKRWTVWTEGKDGKAGESYDVVAAACIKHEEDAALRIAQDMVRRRDVREVTR